MPPSSEDIERGLGFAEIDAQSFADIRHRWSGSVSLLVDRLRPVLAVLQIPPDGLENAQKDEDQLAAWLAAHVLQWGTADLLQAARRSRDDEAMGRKARDALGTIAELPHWNAALASLGDRYCSVRNGDAPEQAKALVTEITPELRAFSRWIAMTEGRPERFLELDKAQTCVSFPAAWADNWWQVPLSAVCNLIADACAATGVAETSLSALRGATTTEQLRSGFRTQGVALDVRPFEVAAENLQRLKATLAVVYDVYLVWYETKGAAQPTHMLDPDKSLHPSSYLDLWDDGMVFRQALAVLRDADFAAACGTCEKAEDLRRHLGLTSDEVEKRRQQRQCDHAEAARKKRTFHVAGQPFEVGKDDYVELFGRLLSGFTGEGSPDVKQDGFTALIAPGLGHKSGGGGGGGKKSSHIRPTPEAREFVGVVGEMLAYYFLRAQFGEAIVSRDAWVSENRLKVLLPVPGEAASASDSYGWDFFFRANGKDWHIEVKATTGDEEEFEMGISEIEAASRLAGSRTKLWCILRIRQALSASPQFDWLPNPFDEGHRSFFRMDRTGTRVSYARKRE
jgi:hypothetical protein